MKTFIFTFAISLSTLLASGQQKLSYTYDAAGNRTNRTIVVAAQNASEGMEQATTRLYLDSLDGKGLSIRADHGNAPLSVTVKGYEPSLNGNYSLMDKDGRLLIRKKLTAETTLLNLDTLRNGSYTFHILLNRHSSIWKVVKL